MEPVLHAMPRLTECDDALYAVVRAILARFKAEPTETNREKFKRAYAAYLAFTDASSEILKCAMSD